MSTITKGTAEVLRGDAATQALTEKDIREKDAKRYSLIVYLQSTVDKNLNGIIDVKFPNLLTKDEVVAATTQISQDLYGAATNDPSVKAVNLPLTCGDFMVLPVEVLKNTYLNIEVVDHLQA